MKELSIEEKAKAYDEALKKAKQFHDKDLFAECNGNLVEYIFPELKEPEDEKVRKALIRFHKSTIDVDGIKGEDIIAWLEKQGEQKQDPRYSIVEDLLAADDVFQMSVNESMVKEAEAMALNAIQKLEVSKLLGLNKQGEQKETLCDECKKEQPSHSCQDITALGRNDEKVSSAWSKEDEKIYQSIMDDTVQENQLNDKQTNWLRDIKYRYFPQPKQEWSKEDERNLEGIIDEIEANKASAPSYDIDTYDRFLSWLKSLKQRMGDESGYREAIFDALHQVRKLCNQRQVLEMLEGML